MDKISVISYWVRVGMVALVALFALISAFRRSRKGAARRDLVAGIITFLAMAVVAAVNYATLDLVITGVLAVLGLVLGLVLGKTRPLISWLAALSAVFASIMVLFGDPKAFSAGLAALVMVGLLMLGQGIRSRIGGAPAAAPAPAVPPQV